MVNNSYEIQRYAIIASSYLISKLSEDEAKNLNYVILFGSAAQRVATADSDIDLFFDTALSKNLIKKLRIKLNKATEEFYLSNIAFEFKLKKISNTINIQIGKLKEWTDLQKSIISTGIVLYGKYSAKIKGKINIIISIEKIRKNRGALLNKLYGYKSGKKHYPGFIEKSDGKRLGITFMMPSEQKKSIMSILEKYKTDYSIREIQIV